jgi:hypothetical protein
MSAEPRKSNRMDKKPSPKSRKPEDESGEDSYDKTIEDSFPASDPPSSIPNPEDEEDVA